MRYRAKARIICTQLCSITLIGLLGPTVFPRPESRQNALAEVSRLLRQLDREQLVHSKGGLTAEDARRLQKEIELTAYRVKGLVDQDILEELNQTPHPDSTRIRRHLNVCLEAMADPQPANAAILELGGESGSVYVVSYYIPLSAVGSMSSISVYGFRGRKYQLLAQAIDPLPSRFFALAPLPSINGEPAFLLHGEYWGDPHHHLSVIAYAFDGHNLKTLLRQMDLVQGQVKVEGDKIELSFLTLARGPGYPSVPERTEIYRVLPSGVSLQSASETKPGG